MQRLVRPIEIPLNRLLAILVLVATLSLVAGVLIGGAIRTEDARRTTRGEEIYLSLARMGFVDWMGACSYASAAKGIGWDAARAACTTEFLSRVRDLRDGEPIPIPGTEAGR